MDKYDLNSMVKGWFVGNFEPTVLKTSDVEVALKKYKAGEYEDKHYHKLATEITVIVEGRVKMLEKSYGSGDIIKIYPGESTDFLAIEDTITLVVKHPGANDDKYLCNSGDD